MKSLSRQILLAVVLGCAALRSTAWDVIEEPDTPERRAKEIIIPEVVFRDAELSAVVAFLSEAARAQAEHIDLSLMIYDGSRMLLPLQSRA